MSLIVIESIFLAWLYRSHIAVGREGVFYLPMVATTCLRGGYRRGDHAPSGAGKIGVLVEMEVVSWMVQIKKKSHAI
jgi:hypothetical protein